MRRKAEQRGKNPEASRNWALILNTVFGGSKPLQMLAVLAVLMLLGILTTALYDSLATLLHSHSAASWWIAGGALVGVVTIYAWGKKQVNRNISATLRLTNITPGRLKPKAVIMALSNIARLANEQHEKEVMQEAVRLAREHVSSGTSAVAGFNQRLQQRASNIQCTHAVPGPCASCKAQEELKRLPVIMNLRGIEHLASSARLDVVLLVSRESQKILPYFEQLVQILFGDKVQVFTQNHIAANTQAHINLNDMSEVFTNARNLQEHYAQQRQRVVMDITSGPKQTTAAMALLTSKERYVFGQNVQGQHQDLPVEFWECWYDHSFQPEPHH